VVGLGAVIFARGRAPAPWLRGLALATIPWAIGIHVVTALLYAGLAARPAWLSAVLAPRFLATAFASGPAVLLLCARALARRGIFDIGREATRSLFVIMTYAALASLLFTLLEVFTALYSGIPAAGEHLAYLFTGLDRHLGLVAFTYGSWTLLLGALVVLLSPGLRARPQLATAAAVAVLVSVLIDKGLCLVTSGFVPSPLGYVHDYWPSLPELAIVVGIYAGGGLMFLGACRFILADHAKLIGAQPSSAAPPRFDQSPATARSSDMASDMASGLASAAQMET
jgi:Ni/Fe-hydrogenase subunit HybB-like protein